MPVQDEFSAGGVACTDDGRIAVVVVRNTKGARVHAIPKGHPEPGEDAKAAALREVQEETGLLVEHDDGVQPAEIDYWFRRPDGDLVHKRVRFFRMRVVGGDPEDHDHEVESVQLLTPAQAAEVLSFDTERGVVNQLCG